MSRPPIGAKIQTRDSRQVQVLQVLGSGRQGTVYRVSYDGQEKALKWYHNGFFKNEEKQQLFYNNLCNNIAHGAPSPQFLWPQDVTERRSGSFGYIMDLRPDRFVDLSTLLVGRKSRFKSFQTRVDAMLQLVSAFRILHNQGFSYQDLNDGNFFFDPNTGEILICDNDNAAYQDYSTGIKGKPRYMAPEVVINQKRPDKTTDRFSMAVVLFLLLMQSHPLEGAASTPPCMTDSMERRFYGEDPIFVFDPNDPRNRPIRGIADHSIDIWNALPAYLRDAFCRSFSKEAMTFDPAGQSYGAPRLIEKEWLDVLARFRNSIFRCAHCPNEVFVQALPAVCDNCGQTMPIVNQLRLAKYDMPMFPGVRLLRCQLGSCSDEQALEPVFEVESAASAPGQYYLTNLTSGIWQCTTSKGIQRPLAPGEKMPVKAGIRASLLHSGFEII
ncbi:MAG: hypothetical protein ACI3XT_06445 [Butyricicoccaceae bacterium]